jgi:uncharacterized protein YggT (Ycf19 family)
MHVPPYKTQRHSYLPLRLYLILPCARRLPSALPQVTDPYLKLFSGLVPPLLGSIDLTPLFGFFILQFLAGALDVADDETRYW